MPTLSAASWNLRVTRHPVTVHREVQALVDNHRPAFLTTQEAAAYAAAVKHIDGYEYLCKGDTGSTKDSGILVRDDLADLVTQHWVQRLCVDGWRGKHTNREHWPRSAQVIVLDGIQVASIHLPPGGLRGAADRNEAYRQCADTLVRMGEREGPIVWAGDWNRRANDPGKHSPAWVADQIDATCVGSGIDYVMARGVEVSNFRRLTEFRHGSDHDPVTFTLEVPVSEPFTVRRRGTDSSGRGIFATDYMWSWWGDVLEHPKVRDFADQVVITQGAFMERNGGGARGSAGYHDKGGAFDLRVWNLSQTQVADLVWAIRVTGQGKKGTAWLRNEQHGGFNDPHIHLILASDKPVDDGIAWQWTEYEAGRNGLSSRGRDYHPRPGENPGPPAGLRIDGVDISDYQDKPIDYAAAKRAGVKWLYHKATEGVTIVHGNYARRRAECKVAGLPFGAYHFARPEGDDAAAEAHKFLDVAGIKPGDLRPMLDLEDDGGLSRADLTRWVKRWVWIVEQEVGAKPIIYTPFDLDDSFGCLLWTARYHPNNEPPRIPAPWKRYDVHQFSDGVGGRPNRVPGIDEACDINTMRPGLTPDDLLIPAHQEEDMPLSDADIKKVTQSVVTALAPVVQQAAKDAVANNMVNVGKPAKWSDDTAIGTILAALGRLEEKVDQQAGG